MPGQGFVVHLGDISLVGLEVIFGMAKVQLIHDPVPGDLGYHRGGRDAGSHLVALPHRQAGNLQAVHGKSVGEYISWPGLKPGQSTTKGLNIGRVHPQTIAFRRWDDHHRPVQGPGDHLFITTLPGLDGQQL